MRKITRSLIFSLTLYRTNDAIKYNLLYEFLRKKKMGRFIDRASSNYLKKKK